MTGKMPDITPAQIVAAFTAIISELASAGLIDGKTSKLLVGLAGIILPFGLVLADSIIRHGRSRALAPTTPVVATPMTAAPIAVQQQPPPAP